MAKAKVLNEKEKQLVWNAAKRSRYALRNRLMLLLGFSAGLRALEIAKLRVCDVVDEKSSTKKPDLNLFSPSASLI